MDTVNMAALRRLVDNPDTYSWDDAALAAMPALDALLAVAEAARVIDERIDFAHDLRRCDMMDSTMPRERQMVCTCGVWEATAALEAALAKLQWEEP